MTVGDAFMLPGAWARFGVIVAIRPEHGYAAVLFQSGHVTRLALAEMPVFQSCLASYAEEIPTARLMECAS